MTDTTITLDESTLRPYFLANRFILTSDESAMATITWVHHTEESEVMGVNTTAEVNTRFEVPIASVNDLRNAFNDQRADLLRLSDLGIDSEWLRREVPPFVEAFIPGSSFESFSPAVRQKVIDRLCDVNEVEGLLRAIALGPRSTGKSFKLRIDFSMADSDVISAEAKSTAAFVLPWMVRRKGDVTTTSLNLAMSIAVGRILPDASLCKEMLLGKDWLFFVAATAMSEEPHDISAFSIIYGLLRDLLHLCRCGHQV